MSRLHDSLVRRMRDLPYDASVEGWGVVARMPVTGKRTVFIFDSGLDQVRVTIEDEPADNPSGDGS